MRTHAIAALLAVSVALPSQAQTNDGVATPYRPPTSSELNSGSATPSRPATTSEVNQGAPSRVGAPSGDNTACCAAGSAPQVQPVVPAVGSGPSGAANQFTLFMCLPTYGGKTLASGGGAGANPNTCVWKSEVKAKQCDCSTYRYYEVHSQSGPNGAARDYEESADGSSCVSYSYINYTYCYDGGCYSQPSAYCPGANMWN